MKTKTKRILGGALGLLLIAATGDGCGSNNSGDAEDARLTAQIQEELSDAHPVPQFDRSQERQNLVELTTARAQSTDTTTFFFNMGVVEPVNSCPSIGYPIPATMQLTNPERTIDMSHGGDHTLPQMEPTGVYTSDTTGTYVLCLNAQGEGYAVYWEGFVQTVTGPAEFNNGQVELIGPPSFDFTTDVGDVEVSDAPNEEEVTDEDEE